MKIMIEQFAFMFVYTYFQNNQVLIYLQSKLILQQHFLNYMTRPLEERQSTRREIEDGVEYKQL